MKKKEKKKKKRDKEKALWVYFVIDTGSPLTYLSTQVNTLIYGNSM